MPRQNLISQEKISKIKNAYGTSVIYTTAVLTYSIGKMIEVLPVWGWAVVGISGVSVVKAITYLSDPKNSSKATIKKNK